MRAKPVATFSLLVLAASCGLARAQVSKPAYLDPAQPIDRRVEDLVSRMTLEEKASQLVNHTRAIPRLGVPEYKLWSEALHGAANNGIATVFPQAIGLAATFDTALVHEMARATALQGRAKHAIAVREGESRAVRLVLGDRDLSHVDELGTRKVAAGAYRISVGGGQPGAENVDDSFTITGERELPR